MPRPTPLRTEPITDVPTSYRRYLRSRWAPRGVALAIHALAGNAALFLLDIPYTRLLEEPPGLAQLAAVRLPWAVLPAAGWLYVRRNPDARAVPALVVTLSVAWAWGMDWAYVALGLGGSTVQALVMVLCFITVARLVPVRLRGRLGMLALMAAGHVALVLSQPARRRAPAAPHLDVLVLLALAAAQTIVSQAFELGQRRRFILHRELVRKVRALELSRARADRAAADLAGLAARVAHDVNNPLAAVKVNVRWLGEPQDPAERREVAAETLEAVNRIAQSVAALEARAVTPAPVPERPGSGSRGTGVTGG